MNSLLEVQGLRVDLDIDGRLRPVLHDVSMQIAPGEALGLVGESGSGKSMTARAIARLLPRRASANGRVTFDGTSVLALKGEQLRQYRRTGIAVVFQDPRAHINPVRTVGDFLTEAMRLNQGAKRSDADDRAARLLDDVGISDGRRRMRQYPHELSGGLLQRVMIAAALATNPRLLLADEPTTALDVTTQADLMATLNELRLDRGTAMLFITHDLDLAAAVCDRTAVMYAGSIVEQQKSTTLQDDPLHPYTAALLRARPSISGPALRLTSLPGQPLAGFEVGDGCAFAPRCAHALASCESSQLGLVTVAHGLVRCRRADHLHGTLLDDRTPTLLVDAAPVSNGSAAAESRRP
jgi:oligopeptide/dipeptide ABC transporter ATP-binding protein